MKLKELEERFELTKVHVLSSPSSSLSQVNHLIIVSE